MGNIIVKEVFRDGTIDCDEVTTNPIFVEIGQTKIKEGHDQDKLVFLSTVTRQ